MNDASRGATRNVLSIAGSDPSGGAGIQADLKTFAALGVYGCAIPAVLTAQNTRGVSSTYGISAGFLTEQLKAVFDDIRIDAVKIGMLGSATAIIAVAEALRRYPVPVVVLDPVMRASTGAPLIDEDAVRVLRGELFPMATLITPNSREAGILLGTDAPQSASEMAAAAIALSRFGAEGALVTGGHVGDADVVTDLLYWSGEITRFDSPRQSADNHGTGCTLSAAIAAYLARGESVASSCSLAQRFVGAAMAAADQLRVGSGTPPLWHRAPEGFIR
jgi:hydroxymethylpyrimidine/phosphomethylpyrimidine kinase